VLFLLIRSFIGVVLTGTLQAPVIGLALGRKEKTWLLLWLKQVSPRCFQGSVRKGVFRLRVRLRLELAALYVIYDGYVGRWHLRSVRMRYPLLDRRTQPKRAKHVTWRVHHVKVQACPWQGTLVFYFSCIIRPERSHTGDSPKQGG